MFRSNVQCMNSKNIVFTCRIAHLLPVLVVIDGFVYGTRRDRALGVTEVATGHIHAGVCHLHQLSFAHQTLLRVRRGRESAAGGSTLLNTARAEVQQLHSAQKGWDILCKQRLRAPKSYYFRQIKSPVSEVHVVNRRLGGKSSNKIGQTGYRQGGVSGVGHHVA